jgi:hypothetical protein
MTSQRPLANSEPQVKTLTGVGFASLAAGLAAMIPLHAASGLDPVDAVISIHLFTPLGWLLPIALSLFAASAWSFAIAARTVGTPRWMMRSLAAWGVLVAMVALFPTDPPGGDRVTWTADVHRYAAFFAFCTMAGLGLAFARWARREGACGTRTVRTVTALSWVAIGSLVAVAVPYAVAFVGVEPPAWTEPAGLTQRMTVGSELIVLAIMGRWLRAAAPRAEAGRATSAPVVTRTASPAPRVAVPA